MLLLKVLPTNNLRATEVVADQLTESKRQIFDYLSPSLIFKSHCKKVSQLVANFEPCKNLTKAVVCANNALGQTFYIAWFTTIFFKDQMSVVGIK